MKLFPIRRRVHQRGFLLIEILLSLGIFGPIFFALILPALGAARRTARQMEGNTRIRGIHQSMFTYGQSNREYFPGLTSRGRISDDGERGTAFDPGLNGASVEHRYAALLDNDAFEGSYPISPSEFKTAWTDWRTPVTASNYSYAFLRIHSDATTVGNGPLAPDQGVRTVVWRTDLDSEVILIADRVKQDAQGGLHSIHTAARNDGSDEWRGSVAWADNHVGFETTHELDTRYGVAPAISNDHLFRTDQGDATFVEPDDGPWDAAMDKANAVMDAVGSSAGVEATRMMGE